MATFVPLVKTGEFEDYAWDCAQSIAYWARAEVNDKSLTITVVGDGEDDPKFGQRATVSRNALQRAAQRIVLGETEVGPMLRGYIVRDDQDAWAMDAIVQIAVFGEIVYE